MSAYTQWKDLAVVTLREQMSEFSDPYPSMATREVFANHLDSKFKSAIVDGGEFVHEYVCRVWR